MAVEVEGPVHASMFVMFLNGGGGYGLVLLALGVLLSLWAVVNLAVVRNRAVVLVQVFLSFVPLVVTLVGVCVAAERFFAISMATSSPDPIRANELPDAVWLGLTCGALGPLSTMIPALLGLIKLALLDSPGRQNAGGPA